MTEIVVTKEGVLREQVQEVFIRRKHLTDLNLLLEKVRSEWKERWADLIEAEAQAQKEEDEAEKILRESALTYYSETGIKVPVPGVEVKIYQVLNYKESEALNWALDKKLPACLKLDKKVFEKIASTLKPEFVTTTEEARCTIATDLAKALSQKEGE